MQSLNIEDMMKNVINKVSEADKLQDFADDLTLSEKEKAFRKYGLKDSRGKYTAIAFDLVIQKLTADNEAYLLELIAGKEKEEKGSQKKTK